MRALLVLPFLLLVWTHANGQTDLPLVRFPVREELVKPPVLQVAEIIDGNVTLSDSSLGLLFDDLDSETEVAVLSIAGEYRTGKSFLLNFFLQYLQHRAAGNPPASLTPEEDLYRVIDQETHPWLRDVNMSSGFHFKSGVKRDTKGLRMYSEPFVIKRSDGKKLAVVVMDTQGLYDPQTSSNDNVKLFAMTSLLSSCLIFNTAKNINSKQLMELKTFRDYATDGSPLVDGTKPFQRMNFLIRDYTLGDRLGWEGGQEVLQQFTGSEEETANEAETGEVQALARNLSASFAQVDAFALPFPGGKVVRRSFDGSLHKIDPDFLHYLEAYVVNVTESLEARKPLLIPLTGDSIVSHIKDVVDTINDKLPPDELMRLNERRLMMSTFRQTEDYVREYEQKMQDPLTAQPDDYFARRDLSQVMDDVEARSQEVSSDILSRFSRLDYAFSYFDVGANQSLMTAMQYLRKQIDTRFQDMRAHLSMIAEKRIQAASITERMARNEAEDAEQMKLEQERRRHEQARRDYERFLQEQNERRRKEREMSFWERLMSFFSQVAGILKSLVGGGHNRPQNYEY